jgi:Ras-related protein Rab-5C
VRRIKGGRSGSLAVPIVSCPSASPAAQIETARGKALADEFGLLFFETSAKDGSNVKEAFHTLARDAVRRLRAAGGGGGAEGASDAAKSVKQLKDRRKQVEGGGKDGRDCVVQ